MYALIRYYRKVSKQGIFYFQEILGYYNDVDEIKSAAWSSIEVKLYELENEEISHKNFQGLPFGFLTVRYDCSPDQLPTQGRHIINYSIFKHYLSEELYHTFKAYVQPSQHDFFYSMISVLIDGANNYQVIVLVPQLKKEREERKVYFVLYNLDQRTLDTKNRIRCVNQKGIHSERQHLDIFKQISKKCYQINSAVHNITPMAYNKVLISIYPFQN